jgi:predicted nucleic acid-binding protein
MGTHSVPRVRREEEKEGEVELLAAHPRLGAGDAIIGPTAIASRSALFTFDRDFAAFTAHGLRLFS